ncbi:MAG: anti-sigma factor, partial [Gemmatimonadota bacterium]|nr:anti-sigma factor [Gemmatimonadota bacterium]
MIKPFPTVPRFVGPLLVMLAAPGCSESVTGLAEGARMQLALTALRPLDPATEGTYELWMVSASGDPTSAGRFTVPAGPAGSESVISFETPIGDPARAMVTIEPPGDQDAEPSSHELLSGPVPGRLTIEGSVTNGLPLERDPGHHSLFTTSNNVEEGYPSSENAGLWLFSITITVNKHRTREVKLTPLKHGWVYAGWIVYRQGTPDEVWVPYGKFRPGDAGLLVSRDNTGSGHFSGDQDFVNGGVEDVPGDEWTTTRVADQLGLTMPGGLTLPLALD